MKKTLIALALTAGATFSAMAQDIVDTAVKAGNFKTLVAAVQAAGLVDTLKGPGPFTVFAPTDEAFAKIPKATLDGLLADKAALTKVLTYHVVPGKVMAKDVKAGNFKTLVAAVQAAGLVDTLKGPGPFTVFAPTDEAFAKIPKATLDGLLADKAALTKVLTYHVVPGKVMAKDVKAGKVKTVQGQEITVSTSMGVMVDQSKVIATDVAASNGVIHAIDTVLMPK